MPETVAVHVMPDRVVLARATGGTTGAELVEIASREVAEGEDARATAIAMARERGITNLGLIVLVNWDQYSLRDAWLPFTDEAKLRSTIKFELEDDFELDGEQLLMPFQLLESRPDSSHVLAWVATKAAIGEAIQAWEGAGLSPEYMPPDIVGHLGLVAQLAPELADQPIVVLSGDERSVHLSLLKNGTIWARRRLLGFAWATDAAGRPLQELRRTMLNVPSFPAPVAVVSFGGEPADVLAGVIARDLGCQHRVIAPPQLSDGERHLQWPLAAGAALMASRSSARPLTFRREEFEPKETAQVVSLLGVVATALLGVIFLVGGLWFLIEARGAQRVTDTVEQYTDTYWKQWLPNDKQRPELASLRTSLNTRINEMEKKLKAVHDRPDAVRYFTLLAERMKTTPDAIKAIEPTRISVGQDSITIAGLATPYDAASLFQKHMNTSSDMTAQLGTVNPVEGGKARFTMTIDYGDKNKPARRP